MKSKTLKIIKGVFLIAVCFSMHTILAQAPQKMSYQAVIRNAANTLVANSLVKIKVSILQSTPTGTVVYSETHTVWTNVNGLVTLEIGTEVPQIGDFPTINWANGPYFIKTETDPSGGTNFTISGTSQLLSVPYALFAEKTNPQPPATFESGESQNTPSQSIRNAWIDYPYFTVTVPETGKYMLSFYGNAYNYNGYNTQTTPDYDGDCGVRVFNITTASELITMSATSTILESHTGGLNRRYINNQPSRFIIVDLTIGDQLRVQYNQYANAAFVTSWTMGASGISILKVD